MVHSVEWRDGVSFSVCEFSPTMLLVVSKVRGGWMWQIDEPSTSVIHQDRKPLQRDDAKRRAEEEASTWPVLKEG